MKTKWYLFFLTVFTATIVIYQCLTIENKPNYKVGVVSAGESRNEKYTGLREGLADLGYTETDFTFTVKNAQDDPKHLNEQIEELLKEDLDLIVALGGIEAIELKKKMESSNLQIPVVFAGVASPKEIGIIDDYQAPGGNFTGINNYHTSLSGKRLEMFHDLIPSIERVFALYDQQIVASRLSLEETIKAGERLAIDVIPIDASTPTYKTQLEQMVTKNDALLILPSYLTESLTDEIVQVSKRNELPVMGIYEHEVESGYLASYGMSFFDQGYQAARFVSSIIQGNSPKHLPVEMPDTLSFLVNKQVVDQFEIEVNNNLMYIAELIHADEEEGK